MAISRVEEIEHAVAQLSDIDLARFREWFAQFDAEQWKRQFEDDVRTGRVDRIAEQAVRDKRDGRCRPL